MGYSKEYFRIHAWLIYWHGRADKCENVKCQYVKPKRFEWALIHGKKYERDRDSFMMLCCSCHRKYDFTEEQRSRMSKAKKGKPAKNKRAVILNGVKAFDSITEASLKTGLSTATIHNNINGLSKKTKLGEWKYLETN